MRRLDGRRGRLDRDQARGQSLVELALVAPILLLLLLGAIDFGRLLQARVTAEAAVRAGASWGATNLQTAGQPLQPAGNAGCAVSSFSPSCNVLAQACLEASAFPGYAGGPLQTGSGGNTYRICNAGTSSAVCAPGPGQANPYLTVTWSGGSSWSSPPRPGDTVTVHGWFCFRTIANFPGVPSRVVLETSSTYTVQQ